MSSVTRVRFRCNEKDCPHREDEDFHKPICRSIAKSRDSFDGIVQHSSEAQHQHWPKRSRGGKEVVAVLCSYCHDRIDNGPWGNEVRDGEYRIWNLYGETLVRVPKPADSEANKSLQWDGSEAESTLSADSGALRAARDGGEGRSHQCIRKPPADDDLLDSSPSPGALGIVAPEGAGEPVLPYRAVQRLTPFDRAEIPLPYPAKFLPNGIEFEPEITFDDMVEVIKRIKREEEGRQWRAGDAVNRAESWSEMWQYLDDIGYKYATLANYANVARAYPLNERRPLSFAHHQALYKREDRYHWLDRAVVEGWTRAELRNAILGPPAYRTGRQEPRAKRWTVADLRESLAAWPGNANVRNNARRWCEAWLDWMEATG